MRPQEANLRWLVNGEEHGFKPHQPQVRVDGERLWIQLEEGWKSAVVAQIRDETHVSFRGRLYVIKPIRGGHPTASPGSGEIRAPMPGRLVAVSVKLGDRVKKGETLMVLEAMKTQISLTAPFDGSVEEIAIFAHEQVKSNQLLAIVK